MDTLSETKTVGTSNARALLVGEDEIMTKQKLLPEIERCVCGHRAIKGEGLDKKYFVLCTRRVCWFGPYKKTERGAINAWNRVMRAAKEAKK